MQTRPTSYSYDLLQHVVACQIITMSYNLLMACSRYHFLQVIILLEYFVWAKKIVALATQTGNISVDFVVRKSFAHEI